jgi:hypothetical protein
MKLNCQLNRVSPDNGNSSVPHFLHSSLINSLRASSAKYFLLLMIFCFPICYSTLAQNNLQTVDADAAYTRTINERAQKIVNTLQLSDEAKALRVRSIIAGQYRNLNDIYIQRDAQVSTVKSHTNNSGEASAKAKLDAIEQETKIKLNKLHDSYLKHLSAELNNKQVEQVKDGMTYGVVQITYKGYQDMIPTLTEEQKKQILLWLVEARELAMDAESSDKKHAWFGKYKGRINNYLSAAGYDLKKAGEEWQNRIKAQAAAKN